MGCVPWSRAAPTSAGAARRPRAPGPRPAAAVPRRGVELPWFFAPPLLLLLLLVLVLLPAAPLLLAPLWPPAPGCFCLPRKRFRGCSPVSSCASPSQARVGLGVRGCTKSLYSKENGLITIFLSGTDVAACE